MKITIEKENERITFEMEDNIKTYEIPELFLRIGVASGHKEDELKGAFYDFLNDNEEE